MVESNNLIMHLLRIITPEEISEIATKHNGGKFLSLTDLAVERFEKKIFRNFADDAEESTSIEESNTENDISTEAKILPFAIPEKDVAEVQEELPVKKVHHGENENMATFILIEKERLKKSQKSLKQKEIIDLYRKNSHVDVEQIKQSNQEAAASDESGILVNKKHY